MRVQLLHVPECPHTVPLLDRISRLVGDRSDVRLESRVIDDEGMLAGLPSLAALRAVLTTGEDR